MKSEIMLTRSGLEPSHAGYRPNYSGELCTPGHRPDGDGTTTATTATVVVAPATSSTTTTTTIKSNNNNNNEMITERNT